jgi:hypothetical protein
VGLAGVGAGCASVGDGVAVTAGVAAGGTVCVADGVGDGVGGAALPPSVSATAAKPAAPASARASTHDFLCRMAMRGRIMAVPSCSFTSQDDPAGAKVPGVRRIRLGLARQW